MSIVLKNQIAASERSAQEIEEKLIHEHRWAMICYDVQDLARTAVELFRGISADVVRWQRDIASMDNVPPEIAGFGKEWESLYIRLGIVFTKTAALIKQVEGIGHAVDGKREFMHEWKELRAITCFSLSDVEKSFERLRNGHGRSLKDIQLELRNNSR